MHECRDPSPCPSVQSGSQYSEVAEKPRPPVYRTVFLTVGVFSGVKPAKNPVNAGENELEPVVGIGRFNPMNGVKIADLLRKSTSLGKALSPSTSRFTGQFSGQFSGKFSGLKAQR